MNAHLFGEQIALQVASARRIYSESVSQRSRTIFKYFTFIFVMNMMKENRKRFQVQLGSAEHAHKTLCSFAFYKCFHIFICLHNVWRESLYLLDLAVFARATVPIPFARSNRSLAKPQMNLSPFGAPCNRSINQRIHCQYEEKDASAHRNQKINIKIYECQINKCLVNWDQNRITNE